jgi:hypothetical protein
VNDSRGAGTLAEGGGKEPRSEAGNACERAAGRTLVAMRVVPSKMLRNRLSWLVVSGVAVILIAGAVDALRSSGSTTPPSNGGLSQEREGEAGDTGDVTPPTTSVETTDAPLKRCMVQQFALQAERLGGSPVLALAHVRGNPCRTPRIRIDISLFDRTGERVQGYTDIQQAFASTRLSPNVEVIAGFQVTYLCSGRKPRRFVAEARPYVVRGWLPRGYGACIDDLGP